MTEVNFLNIQDYVEKFDLNFFDRKQNTINAQMLSELNQIADSQLIGSLYVQECDAFRLYNLILKNDHKDINLFMPAKML